MAQYIDKYALVAEIKERIKTYNKGYANGDDSRADALEVLLHNIDTLEVKEVDFDAEWKRYFEHRGEIATVNVKHLAKNFFELGMSVINKAQKGE